MDTFLTRSASERTALFQEAGARLGLAPPSIEKDFWACWTLRELFALGDIGPRLTFKGGTSLSKAWSLIQRFSEDLDVVVDRDFLGFGGGRAPEDAPSSKQRGKRLEDLRSVCQVLVAERLHPALDARFRRRVPANLDWTLEVRLRP